MTEIALGADDDELLVAFYDGLYLAAFVHQREPLDAWRRALAGGEPYAWSVVVAGDALRDPARRRIDGGIVFERYPRSGCGLITYLVVAPHARRTGLGERLLARARASLAGAPLVVGEVHVPDSDEARARIAWFAKRNARVLDVRYVQPDLGFGRDRALHMIAFFDAAPPADVDGAALRAFLREFYETVEGAIDADTEAMLASIGPRVRCY
jgi:GNAT superfamily N-acetyltransferase